jgi:hypothetical protein
MSDNFMKVYEGLELKPRSTDPANPVEGDIQFADGTIRPKGLWVYKDGAWEQAGGSGGGGLDIFVAQDFEALGVGDFTSGLNAVYKTAGSFGGALSSETTNPIAGDSSPKYTAGVTSTNDWFDVVETVDLDLKQRRTDVGITLYADMTNFSVDAEFVVWDVTNSVKLDTSGSDVLVGGSGRSRYSFTIFIPSTTTQISYGFHMVNAPVNTESFIFDDIEFSTNPFIYQELLNIEEWTDFTPATDDFGTIVNASGKWRRVGDTMEVVAMLQAGVPSGGDAAFYIPTGLTIDSSKLNAVSGRDILGTYVITRDTLDYYTTDNAGIIAYDTSTLDKVKFSQGASSTLVMDFEAGNFIMGISEAIHVRFSVPILEWAATTEHIIVPAETNLEEWTAFTPIIGGTTHSGSAGYWRQVGDSMEVSARFFVITPNAGSATVTLPNGHAMDFAKLLPAQTEMIGQYVRTNGTSKYYTGNNAGIMMHDGFSGTTVLFSDSAQALGFMSMEIGNSGFAAGEGVHLRFKVPIVGWSAESKFLAALPSTYWQTKKLTSSISTSGTVTDLTFNGLVIGKTYKVSMQGQLETDDNAGETSQLKMMHDGVMRSRVLFTQGVAAGVTFTSTCSAEATFIATATIVTFEWLETASASLAGDNTFGQTWAKIEELPYHKTTTRFT